MISGFCSAGSALDRPDYIQTAVKAANFIKQHMFDHEVRQLRVRGYVRYRGVGTVQSGTVHRQDCKLRWNSNIQIYLLID